MFHLIKTKTPKNLITHIYTLVVKQLCNTNYCEEKQINRRKIEKIAAILFTLKSKTKINHMKKTKLNMIGAHYFLLN